MPDELTVRRLQGVLVLGWELPTSWDEYSDRHKQSWIADREGLEPPPGVENYEPRQLYDWLKHQKKRRADLQRIQQLIESRARAEQDLELPPIEIRNPSTDVDPDNPKYVIRAVYGPVQGLPLSRIVALNYKEKYLERRTKIDIFEDDLNYGRGLTFEFDGLTLDGVKEIPSDVVGTCADHWGNKWGPRRFLWEVLNAAAKLGGDVVLYFPHNNVKVRMWPANVQEMTERMLGQPVRALVDTEKLVEE